MASALARHGLNGSRHQLLLSIGAAEVDQRNSLDIQDLRARVDEAMYWEKWEKREQIQWLTMMQGLLCFFCGSRPATVVGLGFLIIVLPWWPVIFSVVRNDLDGLFRRTLIPVPSLRECSGRDHAQHRYHQQFSR